MKVLLTTIAAAMMSTSAYAACSDIPNPTRFNPVELSEYQECWLDEYKMDQNAGILGSLAWVRLDSQYFSAPISILRNMSGAYHERFLSAIEPALKAYEISRMQNDAKVQADRIMEVLVDIGEFSDDDYRALLKQYQALMELATDGYYAEGYADGYDVAVEYMMNRDEWNNEDGVHQEHVDTAVAGLSAVIGQQTAQITNLTAVINDQTTQISTLAANLSAAQEAENAAYNNGYLAAQTNIVAGYEAGTNNTPDYTRMDDNAYFYGYAFGFTYQAAYNAYQTEAAAHAITKAALSASEANVENMLEELGVDTIAEATARIRGLEVIESQANALIASASTTLGTTPTLAHIGIKLKQFSDDLKRIMAIEDITEYTGDDTNPNSVPNIDFSEVPNTQESMGSPGIDISDTLEHGALFADDMTPTMIEDLESALESHMNDAFQHGYNEGYDAGYANGYVDGWNDSLENVQQNN